jgi:hypothetical protein
MIATVLTPQGVLADFGVLDGRSHDRGRMRSRLPRDGQSHTRVTRAYLADESFIFRRTPIFATDGIFEQARCAAQAPD